MITYIVITMIGIVLISISFFGIFKNKHIISDFLNKLQRNEVNLIISGVELRLLSSEDDRKIAWEIFTEINTRIAVVDFNEDYDSFYHVHKSLYTMFQLVRDKIKEIPVDTIKDDNNQIIDFYLRILNDGIRPYLSKWHIPISQWVKNNEKENPKLSILEIEKNYPQRTEILSDIKLMNLRMSHFSDVLLNIAKGKHTSIKIDYYKKE